MFRLHDGLPNGMKIQQNARSYFNVFCGLSEKESVALDHELDSLLLEELTNDFAQELAGIGKGPLVLLPSFYFMLICFVRMLA